MIHSPEILDRLTSLPRQEFAAGVFRATRQSLDPLAPSTRGGRWAPPNEFPVLYTSLSREGALAELVFHWSQLSPLPTKPAALHRIRLTARKVVRLDRAQLSALGVESNPYAAIRYERTQRIGAAAWFLECDALIVPSARWDSENLILFTGRHSPDSTLELLGTELVEWIPWAVERGFLDAKDPGVLAAWPTGGSDPGQH